MKEERGSSSPTVVIGTSQYEKPKTFIEAFSELEQMSAVLGEEEIPSQFFTLKQFFDFFGVGFKDSLKASFIAGLFSPIMIGVIKEIIPIFGDITPSLFDKVFSLLLSLGYSIGYALLVASLSRYYYSNKVIKKAMGSFLNGLILGKVVGVGIIFVLFHFLYFWLSPEVVGKVIFEKLRIGGEGVGIYNWVIKFKEVFLVSAWFIVFSGVLFILIPLFGLMRYKIKEIRRKRNVELL